MTRLVFVLFALLTLGAGYLTFYGVGAQDLGIERNVRQRSGGNVFFGGGK